MWGFGRFNCFLGSRNIYTKPFSYVVLYIEQYFQIVEFCTLICVGDVVKVWFNYFNVDCHGLNKIVTSSLNYKIFWWKIVVSYTEKEGLQSLNSYLLCRAMPCHGRDRSSDPWFLIFLLLNPGTDPEILSSGFNIIYYKKTIKTYMNI
jgi:hypothetical protein